MIKKLLIIAIASTLSYAGSHSATFKRKTEENKNQSISVRGIVTDISERSRYIRVKVSLDNGKDIKGRISKESRLKENDRVYGRCTNYKSGEYRNCSLLRTKY